MILAIKLFSTFIILALCYTGNAKSDSHSYINTSIYTSYQELIDENICGDQTRFELQEKILKKHNLINNEKSASKHVWLSSPYDCTLTSINSEYFYIYSIYDKNSPTYVFILLNKENKKYLLAIVDRDYTQDISDGRISYMGTLVTSEKAVQVLQNYISNQKYGGVKS